MDIRYAVIGKSLSHTMLPEVHARLFEYAGASGSYDVLETEPEELESTLQKLTASYDGFNVEAPYKTQIVKYLDTVDKTVMLCGAVNTVKVQNGQLYGYNTEPDAFIDALKKIGFEPKDKKVLILGSGAFASGAAYALCREDAKVSITARNDARSLSLAKRLKRQNPKFDITAASNLSCEKIDLLVNCTPVGAHPNATKLPIETEILKRTKAFFEVVCSPKETLAMKVAKEGGGLCENGLSMLVSQAASAHNIWYGAEFDNTALKAIAASHKGGGEPLYNKNILLCGMPGSGKSTLAPHIARYLGFEAVSVDRLIEEREGILPTEIISRYGEGYFEIVEYRAMRGLLNAKNLVIDAGADTVLNDKVMKNFKDNAVNIFLDAPLNVLAFRVFNGKPSQYVRENRIEELFFERHRLYEKYSDFAYKEVRSPEDMALDIVLSLT